MNQKGNVVGGHMAGRDVIVSTAPATFMSQLQERFEQERATNADFRAVVEQLEYYKEPIDQPPIGLEKKLELGGRHSYIPEALRSKELFAKLMTRYNLSEAAQLVFAFCLGRVEQLFTARVVPLINQGTGFDEVDSVLMIQVVQPVLDELEVNFLSLTPQSIKGMVYYLTANCFLRWHQQKSNANLSSST